MLDSSVSCIPARGVCSFEYVVSLGSTFSSIGCMTSLSRVYLLGVSAHLNITFFGYVSTSCYAHIPTARHDIS